MIDEFHGKLQKLILHNEAGVVVNNIYRDICTPAQKIDFLHELYGPEFGLFQVISMAEHIYRRARRASH